VRTKSFSLVEKKTGSTAEKKSKKTKAFREKTATTRRTFHLNGSLKEGRKLVSGYEPTNNREPSIGGGRRKKI